MVGTIKISQLPSASTPLTGSEEIPVVQSAITARTTTGYLLSRANQTGTQAISTVANLQTELDSKLSHLATRTAVKALGASVGASIFLTEGGRAGIFTLTSGNYSSQISNDPREGVVFADGTISSSSAAWVRQFEGAIDVMWFGAAANAITDDSAAFQAALNYCKAYLLLLRVPAGEYAIKTKVTLSSFAGLQIIGDGLNNTRIYCGTSGDAFEFTNVSRGRITDIAWSGSAMSTGDGVVINGASSGVMEVARCQFAGFPGRGLYFDGSAGSGSSSNLIIDNLFLSCGESDGVPQFEGRSLADSKIGRNQFGVLTIGDRPPIGCRLYNSGANDVFQNYHWENVVGAEYDTCSYTRFLSNRHEENQREGAKFKNTQKFSIVGNHCYANSKESSGTYDGMTFEACALGTGSANQFYTWNLDQVRYSINFDGSCNSIVFSGTIFGGYATAPTNNISGLFNVIFKDSLPYQLGYDQQRGTLLPVSSGGAIAALTSYMGPSGGSTAEATASGVVPLACVATTLVILSTDAPGAGQTYTFTLRKNAADTAITGVISGASSYSLTATGLVTFSQGDRISVKVVASAGAFATPTFVGSVILAN